MHRYTLIFFLTCVCLLTVSCSLNHLWSRWGLRHGRRLCPFESIVKKKKQYRSKVKQTQTEQQGRKTRKQFLEEQLLELKGQVCSGFYFEGCTGCSLSLWGAEEEANRRSSRTAADPAVSALCFVLDTSRPVVRSLQYCDNIYYYYYYFNFYYLVEKQISGGGRRRASHGALLPGVGHNRESPAWPKHPLWWQSVAKFINNWGQVFTPVFIFPAGPEGYSALYETNGCRLDARGLWAFCALMG